MLFKEGYDLAIGSDAKSGCIRSADDRRAFSVSAK
jgi:hypothetical protein